MMNSNQTSGACPCKATLNRLRAIDFAIQETVLYLDAYPHNQEALHFYHQLCEQRKEVMCAYEKQCGPITMYGNTSQNSWDWVKDPWPWEANAN